MSFFQNYNFKSTGVALTSAGQFLAATVGTEFEKNSGEVFVKSTTNTLNKAQQTFLNSADIANKYATLNTLGVANGIATLDGNSLIPVNQLPSISITDTFVVATEAAMLALTVQVGDVCVRTDINNTYILSTSPGTLLSNWTEMLSPMGSVSSVNGQTGAVNITKADVGLGLADNTADLDKPMSTATQTYVDNNAGSSLLASNNTFTGTNTFSGAVTLGADPINVLEAATKQYVDNTTNNTSASQSIFTAVGDGVKTAFAATDFSPVGFTYPLNAAIEFFISGVYQHSTAYTRTDNTTVTFASAPPTGNIEVRLVQSPMVTAGILYTAEKGVANGVATLDANGNLVQMPNKTDIGLNAVDNTSDLNKPVSAAQQTAIDAAALTGALAGAAAEVQAGRTNSVKRADGTWSVHVRNLPNDYALQTWADDLALGAYDVNLTVAQNGLPVGWWYIEVLRHVSDNITNQYRYLRATPLDATLASQPVYHCSVTGSGWSAWTPMARLQSTAAQAQAGIDTTTDMSPMAVKLAIDAAALTGAAAEVQAGRTNSVKRADGTWSVRVRNLPNDYALQTWADDLALGAYDVNLTVAQNGLPVGWWYIEVLRHVNDTVANQFRYLRATPMAVPLASRPVYHCSDVNGGWSAWSPMSNLNNQNWTNVTALRAVATTYTNSTGQPIYVSVIGSVAAQAAANMFMVVDGSTVVGDGSSQAGGITAGITGIVPNGSTYSITTVNTALTTWMELR